MQSSKVAPMGRTPSRAVAAFCAGCLAAVMTAGAHADTDSTVSREREMLRRTQEALHQSQSDNAELSQAKQAAERKVQEAAREIESVRNASRSAEASLHTQLQNAATVQAALQQKIDEANRQIAALAVQEKETAAQLSLRESELQQTQQTLASSRSADALCEAKNLKLYEYSQELLRRYEKKGVWAALSQKEPVLGLKEVGIENLTQEYREKLASQKLQPSDAATPGTVPPRAR